MERYKYEPIMNKDFLNEIEEKEIDLSSFEIQTILNPFVWVGGKMKSNIRLRLLEIAKDFIDDLDVPWVKVKDITLTGSMSNFNWSDYSDFDLHILIDFSDVNNNIELVENYFIAKKNVWNEKHTITLHDYDVEVYVQNTEEPHSSTGVFSLKDGKWLVKPILKNPKLDSKLIKKKAVSIIGNIEYAVDLFKRGEYSKVVKIHDKIMDKIKLMRQTGLGSIGEFSYENIAFKVLRRSDYLELLSKIATKSYDLDKSMDESKNE